MVLVLHKLLVTVLVAVSVCVWSVVSVSDDFKISVSGFGSVFRSRFRFWLRVQFFSFGCGLFFGFHLQFRLPFGFGVGFGVGLRYGLSFGVGFTFSFLSRLSFGFGFGYVFGIS